MATSINDVANAVAVNIALAPVVRTTSVNGTTIDMITTDGPCFAVQQIGAISEDVAWAGHIEESADGSTWSDIDDAEFTSVDAPSNVQTIMFRRAKRYVRYVGTPTGTDPSVPVSAIIGALRKTF